MQLKSMFAKPIDRDIKGVIKVGQGDDANVRQELEEYVVTRELEKHLRSFFSAYANGINGGTDKMGVWISGFFGSGKSHFLKILSYLLDGKRTIDGKTALDYFTEGNKISDASMLADMQLAARTPADVILFNIDSKGDMSGRHGKDAIASVLLKVFNEMQGFCGSMPFLAELERKLAEAERFEEFKRVFAEAYGSEWTQARGDFDFIQDTVVDVLDTLGFMSVEAARNWCERAAEPYSISIEDFALLVKKYIDKQEKNHHVIFLVDEIGQYIGDDSKLMLNLQTVAEDLGTFCGGKAWIIVTSQQDIDSITKAKGNDFSKIQGRFDTRLSLSSANVDEVIRKRILEKNDSGKQTLTLLYDEKETILKNLITFNDGIDKKHYSSREDFADVYPFVPYQFNLLGSVLTSIRTHGASGKHLAEGERSMLALFKDSAVRVMNEEQGALIPFSMFYDALERFLDHSHSGVITRALDNEYLNPQHEAECFDVEVLKVLFLIKYVKEIRANADNITSLMAPSIDCDRLKLDERVRESLKRLVGQTLVQNNIDEYVFLTDEEQEVNRSISNQHVETSEVTARVSDLIFEDLYKEKKYRYPAHNGRYTFGFNQYVDDRAHKSGTGYDLSLKILTPNDGKGADEAKLQSTREYSAFVVLPEDVGFLDELRAVIKIDKYLRSIASEAPSKHEQVKISKTEEARQRDKNARSYLEDALRQATIFIDGNELRANTSDISTRFNEALAHLVGKVYHKLSYIDVPMNETSIRRLLTSADASAQIMLDMPGGNEPNKFALSDVADYINMNSSRHAKTSLKSLIDRFTKAPYGFVDDDVRWLVARLFKNSDITLSVNNEPLTLLSRETDELIRYLTRREFAERLLCDRRERASEKQKKIVRKICDALWSYTPTSDDDDTLIKDLRRMLDSLRVDIEKYDSKLQRQSAYPGKQVIRDARALIADVTQITDTSQFFQTVAEKEADFLDLADQYEPLKKFFDGEQSTIFDKAIRLMDIYEASKTFIVNPTIERTAGEVNTILKMPVPYGEINKLPSLLAEYTESYDNLLHEMEVPVLAAIEQARERVFDELRGKACAPQLNDSFVNRWHELREKVATCSNAAILQNIKVEADALKTRMLNEIAEAERKSLAPKPTETLHSENGSDSTSECLVADSSVSVKPQKSARYISIRSISPESSWRLESEADVDHHLTALREKLLGTLEADTIITIEL
jgi:hypothetical protein